MATQRLSLQTPQGMQFGVFEGSAVTPQRVEVGKLLGNAFNTIEQRVTNYNEKLSALDAAFSKMRETLPNDEETLKWFDGYQQKYKDQIKAFADNYDYGTAINMAIRAGGDAVNSAEYTGRKRYYAEREEWVDALEKRGDLTSRDKDYWKRHYPQAYEDVKDASGKIIGGNHFEAPTPIKSIDWEDAIKSADENVAEDVQGNESSSSYTDDYGGRSSGSSRVTRKKPLSKLIQGLREYMGKNPQIGKQFDVAYAELKDDYDDLIKERDNFAKGTPEYDNAQMELNLFLERVGSKNGGLPDKASWFEYKVTNSEYAKLHAYENVQQGSQSSESHETKGSVLVDKQAAANLDFYNRTHPQPGATEPEQGKNRNKTINLGYGGEIEVPGIVVDE